MTVPDDRQGLKSGTVGRERAGGRWLTDHQLQVGLYMLAVRKLLELEPVAVYQPLRGGGLRPRGVFESAAPVGRHVYHTDAVTARSWSSCWLRSRPRRWSWRRSCGRRNDPVPGDVLAERMPASRDLLGLMVVMEFTEEQLRAIERREGDLLLDAGAGSGKTAVLVERFVRAVIDDGVDVGRILAITFTEKAAAELRDRVRARLKDLGDQTSAAATEGAWISTIHAFCARVLHTHALAAGLDPAFTVLDDNRAAELSGAAFDGALAELARSPQGAELVAHTSRPCSGGPLSPSTASCGRSGSGVRRCPCSARAFGRRAAGGVRELAFAAARGLGEIDQPGVTVAKALDTLTRAGELLAGELPWPGDLEAISLPGGAAALTSDPCEAYRAGLAQLRQGLASELAIPMRDALDELLRGYGERYGQLKQRSSALDFDDLELLARDLLSREEIGSRYRERFEHVMVDELQDTNRVQLELIELVAAGGALFMVGDAQQSIYGFRNADVELFEERGRELERVGGRRR